MQTVGQQLGKPQLQVFDPSPALVANDAIGIELELEGFTDRSMSRAGQILGDLWNIDRDGSLRNGGVEFITNGGLGGTVLVDAIDRMDVALTELNFMDTFRCSTHMHINMRDFTIPQVVRFILLYTAAEPLMFSFCGEYRYSSNFCTPVAESIPFHKRILSALTEAAVKTRYAARFCNKYTALNISPLFPEERTGRALGTVEFRGSRALTNKHELLQLANMLLSVKKYAREFDGDNEAMLSSISGGLVGTLFDPALVSNLGISQSESDRGMVNAWLLLKSHQQGIEVARSRERQESEQLERMSASIQTPQWAIQGQNAQRVFDATSASALAEEADSLIQSSGWDELNAIRNHLIGFGSSTSSVVSYGIRALERIPAGGQHTARSWILDIAAGYTSRDSLTRSTTFLQSLITRRVLINSTTRNPRPFPFEDYGYRINPAEVGVSGTFWLQRMPPRVVERFLIALFPTRRVRDTVTNWECYERVKQSSVRTKGREALNEALRSFGVQYEVNEIEPVWRMRRLLRTACLPASQHVWRVDLPEYRTISMAIDTLSAFSMAMPTVSSDSNGYYFDEVPAAGGQELTVPSEHRSRWRESRMLYESTRTSTNSNINSIIGNDLAGGRISFF